jgi:hypothetical protein
MDDQQVGEDDSEGQPAESRPRPTNSVSFLLGGSSRAAKSFRFFQIVSGSRGSDVRGHAFQTRFAELQNAFIGQD